MAEARWRDLADPAAAVADGRLTPDVRGRLDRLDALTAATLAELETLARFRDDFPDRAAALHAAVDELAVAEAGAAREFAVARAKIAETGLPTPPRATHVLRARLRQVDGYARHRQWPRAVDGYVAVSAALTAARQRTAELRAAAAGLLQRRDELRGRLESYRMKAAAAGFAEDDRLAERHDQARQLLYTAPCDLRAATRAVHAYRAALAELSEEGR
ncbi:hypothetical protein [Dactylosporangium darangshiense]